MLAGAGCKATIGRHILSELSSTIADRADAVTKGENRHRNFAHAGRCWVFAALVFYAGAATRADAYEQADWNKLWATHACARCNLSGANLHGQDLRGVNLTGADLSNADLSGANLSEAHLAGADLSKADLGGANLAFADLSAPPLPNCPNDAVRNNARLLAGADFSKADLQNANLRGTWFYDTDLRETKLGFAALHGAAFDVEADKIPPIAGLVPAKGVASVTYWRFPVGMIALRNAAATSGFRNTERLLTYAIKHTQRQNLMCSKGWFRQIEGYFNLILFELTSGYGMRPGRPLLILLGLTLVFCPIYTVAILRPDRSLPGIWLVRSQGQPGEAAWEPSERLRRKGIYAILWGLYFSIVSAFNIGWREFNVGDWIMRIQPSEFTFRATGWVRVLSGVQSLVSVYLVALWVLTYFGRPFD